MTVAPIEPADLLTIDQVAELTGRTPATVRQWIKRELGFPAPWRPGAPGDPHLYLRAAVVEWCQRTGRSLSRST